MTPFDIEKAKAGAQVRTRDGRKVRILCYDLNSSRPIVAAITTKDGHEFETSFFPDGRLERRQFLGNKGHEADIVSPDRGEDLMMAE